MTSYALDMKSIIYTMALCFVLHSCQNSGEIHPKIEGGLKIVNRYYDIGRLHATNDTLAFTVFSYNLENVGTSDIVIDGVDLSCGCLSIDSVPDVIPVESKREITGRIKLKGLKGHVSKSMFLNFNGNNTVLLRVVGEVR